MVGRFGSKVGQIGPKWDETVSFKMRFQYILAHRAYFGPKPGQTEQIKHLSVSSISILRKNKKQDKVMAGNC